MIDGFQIPEMPTKDELGLALPPFAECPDIKRGSVGFRMGYGESYSGEFDKWWSAQDQETRLKTKEAYPEPEGWDGYWLMMMAQTIGE